MNGVCPLHLHTTHHALYINPLWSFDQNCSIYLLCTIRWLAPPARSRAVTRSTCSKKSETLRRRAVRGGGSVISDLSLSLFSHFSSGLLSALSGTVRQRWTNIWKLPTSRSLLGPWRTLQPWNILDDTRRSYDVNVMINTLLWIRILNV